MASSSIGSPTLEDRVPLVLDPPDDGWFDVGLIRKDIILALGAATDVDVPARSAAVAEELLARAAAMAYVHRDIAALREVLERVGGDGARRRPDAACSRHVHGLRASPLHR